MGFYDDRLFYDNKNNQLWVGCPDVKVGNGPWEFHFFTRETTTNNWCTFRARLEQLPGHFKLIAKEPERSLSGE